MQVDIVQPHGDDTDMHEGDDDKPGEKMQSESPAPAAGDQQEREGTQQASEPQPMTQQPSQQASPWSTPDEPAPADSHAGDESAQQPADAPADQHPLKAAGQLAVEAATAADPVQHKEGGRRGTASGGGKSSSKGVAARAAGSISQAASALERLTLRERTNIPDTNASGKQARSSNAVHGSPGNKQQPMNYSSQRHSSSQAELALQPATQSVPVGKDAGNTDDSPAVQTGLKSQHRTSRRSAASTSHVAESSSHAAESLEVTQRRQSSQGGTGRASKAAGRAACCQQGNEHRQKLHWLLNLPV